MRITHRFIGLSRVRQGDTVVSAEIATIVLLGETAAVEGPGLEDDGLEDDGIEDDGLEETDVHHEILL